MSIKDILSRISKKISKKDNDLIVKAYNFAKDAHLGHKRISGCDYFVHPFETAKILAELDTDAKTIAAGLLHDVLEEDDVSRVITENEVREKFGPDILLLIKGVTKLKKIHYTGYQRHIESLRKFFIAVAKDLRIVIIKFADRLDNLKTLNVLREDKRKRIAMDTIEIYAPLANRLGMGKIKGELEDGAFPYAYPKECSEMEKLIENNKEIYQKNLREVVEILEEELKENKIKIINIDYRIKHKYSLWKKLIRNNMDLEKVYDIIALRIIVKNVTDCYRVLGVVHSLWKPLIGRIKDYIAIPKANGYRSLHTTIFTGSDGIVEIQIRTEEMHQEAEYGIASHFSYKEMNENTRKLSKGNRKLKLDWLNELKNIKYTPDIPTEFISELKKDFFSDRIFVFTPNGDVIDLPENSTPIDFAYSIHSDLGNHIAGVKINKKLSSIFIKLNNGDIIEIIKKKDAHPSEKWLEHAKTSTSQKHIRSYLEKNSLLSRLKSITKFKH